VADYDEDKRYADDVNQAIHNLNHRLQSARAAGLIAMVYLETDDFGASTVHGVVSRVIRADPL
jgi:hypothetical protein